LFNAALRLAHPPQGLMPGRGEAVLVVDDEDRLREMLVEVLEANGYSVGLASNGREALDLYRQALATQAPFGLVLLDLAMPVMSGQECIKELLVLDPNVKILVMSGLLEAVEKDQDLQRVRGFLHKPFLLTKLLQEVRRALENEIKAG
jgi:CheY-like chemotaxis protein